MKVGKTVLSRAIKRILTVAKPQRIILFGSAVTGEVTRDSDLDLLVIETDFVNEREEGIRLRVSIGDLGLPVDVFAMTPERFDETKNVIGGLAYPAHKYGKVIYEAA